MRNFRIPLVLTALAFMAVGCSSDTPLGADPVGGIGGDNSIENLDLNQPYGGLAYTDDRVAFGDPTLELEASVEDAAAIQYAAFEDSVLDEDPEFDRPDLVRTWVRILWGNHDGRPDSLVEDGTLPERTPVVWDGNLQVTGKNRLALKRALLFERPTDRIVLSREQPRLGWISRTKWHVDGILVCVLSRPDSNGVLQGDLEFNSGPFSTSIPVQDLLGYEQTTVLDDAGNAISFVGFRPDPESDCARGFLGGHWMDVPDENGGVFRGRMLMATGNLRAWIGGRYGINDAGERVFAGKIVDREGTILGLIEGTWEPSEDGRRLGSFVGHWAVSSGERKGRLGGHYRAAPLGHRGIFLGRWAENCSEEDLSAEF